ncbi:hypothetical protein Tco_0740848 [Tanacetum coccineum]
MEPLSSSQERKPRRDRDTRKGRTSTSLIPAFGEPSSSHPTNDDEDDEHNEGTSHASTPSPVSYVNSLTNQVPQVFQNPPNIDPHLEPFYTRQTEIINRQVQIRDEHRGGVAEYVKEDVDMDDEKIVLEGDEDDKNIRRSKLDYGAAITV